MQPAEMSFTNLIFEASPLVQIVMLILLSMSIASWAIIVQRTKILKAARMVSEQFEERFWSGIDLNRLYQECSARRDELTGMEQVFFAGFKEFARLHTGGPRSQEMVMDGTYRAMRVALSREVDDLETSLPVLATFHRKLRAEVPLQNQLEDNARAPWLLARRLLAESYQQQFQESET